MLTNYWKFAVILATQLWLHARIQLTHRRSCCFLYCSVLCSTLKSGGQCGHPFCDSMVLTHTGTIYGLSSVVSRTQPIIPTTDSSCGTAFGLRNSNGQRWGGVRGRHAKLPQAWADKSQKTKKADTAHIAYQHQPYGPTSYYEGGAALYTGPVTITSSKYNIKYHEGFMDYVEMDPGSGEITPAQAAGKHMVLPFSFVLQVKKPYENY